MPLFRPNPSPPYVSAGFITLPGGVSATAAVGLTMDTVVGLIPFEVRRNVAIVSMNIRTTTGAAGSAVKMALWSSSLTTGFPTGVALVGSNTGPATTGNNTTQTIAVSITLQPGVRYWYGVAFTTLAPTVMSLAATGLLISAQFGRTAAVNNNMTLGFSAPYAYAASIVTLDLSAASFTELASTSGVPIMYLGT